MNVLLVILATLVVVLGGALGLAITALRRIVYLNSTERHGDVTVTRQTPTWQRSAA